MADQIFKVCYSTLEPPALGRELQNRYAFGEQTTCRLLRSGMNDVYIVTAGVDTYYLRVAFAGSHELTDYQEEAAVMLLLNDNGVNTAVPVRCGDGYVWPVNAPEGIRYAVLFTEAKSNPSSDSLKMNFNLGQASAKLHAIADEHNPAVSRAPIDFQQLIRQPLTVLSPYMERQRPEDYGFIRDGMQRLETYIADRLSYEKPCWGFCHGDIQISNVYFDGDDPTFFDFDTMGMGWRVHDISVHIFNYKLAFGVAQGAAENESNLGAFLNGYNSIRQLSEREMECINAFGAIRAIWALAINVDLANKKTGCIYVNHQINYFLSIFKTWFGKVFAEPQHKLGH